MRSPHPVVDLTLRDTQTFPFGRTPSVSAWCERARLCPFREHGHGLGGVMNDCYDNSILSSYEHKNLKPPPESKLISHRATKEVLAAHPRCLRSKDNICPQFSASFDARNMCPSSPKYVVQQPTVERWRDDTVMHVALFLSDTCQRPLKIGHQEVHTRSSFYSANSSKRLVEVVAHPSPLASMSTLIVYSYFALCGTKLVMAWERK